MSGLDDLDVHAFYGLFKTDAIWYCHALKIVTRSLVHIERLRNQLWLFPGSAWKEVGISR